MSQLRVAVLNAAHESKNTTRNFRRELDASLSEFDATRGELPEEYDFDAVVVTGSRSSVYWDEEWIPPTKEWTAEAIDRGIPFLGICWGHQLLADVLGGTVEDMGTYEVGYSEIEHTGDSLLFEGIDAEFTAYTSHSDAVTELPSGATSLATNEYSNHGFHKDHVFGVQFHPEFDQQTVRRLLAEKELSAERREQLLAEVTDENHLKTCQAKLVFENFLEYVRELRGEGAAASDVEDASA